MGSTRRGERTRYYKDDDVAFDELVAREKRTGGESYEDNYVKNITRNKRYKV